MNSARILIVEDDADHGRSLLEAVADLGYAAEWAETGSKGVRLFKESGADLVLTDLVLPDIDGIEVMKQIRDHDAGRTPVILMTAYGSIDSSVRAMKEGAYDYLTKPLDLDDLQAKLARALETVQLRQQVKQLNDNLHSRWSVQSWVAESPVMREVIRETLALAQSNATVLVRGESGTGKELVARALHAEGPRSEGPFVAVNCGAFTETLLESELFGHEKGAFTGASVRHAGAFERAEGGTLFLDEIGDAPATVQVKLLRVLEDHEILRVGGQKSFKANVRLVSATNRDLEVEVQEGRFRQDLLYRLQVVALTLPPLRDRPGDIRVLAERFIATASANHGRRIHGIEPDWYARLEAYSWPGNIRELRNVVEAAVVTAPDQILKAERLRLTGVPVRQADAPSPVDPFQIPPDMTLQEIEKKIIMDALVRHHGNRSLTAEQLGLSRRTIQRKIQDYQLPF